MQKLFGRSIEGIGINLAASAIVAIGIALWGHVTSEWQAPAMVAMGLVSLAAAMVITAIWPTVRRQWSVPIIQGPVTGDSGHGAFIEHLKGEHAQKQRNLETYYKDEVHIVQLHASSMTAQLATKSAEISRLENELRDTRPESAAMATRERKLTDRERAIGVREEAERVGAARMKAAAIGKVDRVKLLEGENDILQRQVTAARSESAQCWQKSAYGGELSAVEDLAPATQEAVRVQLSQLAPLLAAMLDASEAMWLQVGDEAVQAGDATPQYWVRLYINENEHYFCYRIGQRFWEINGIHGDLRPILGRLCINYFKFRTKLLYLAELTGRSAASREGYGQWRQAEVAFFTELQKKVAIDEAEHVEREIRAYWGNQGLVIRIGLPPESLVLPPPAA